MFLGVSVAELSQFNPGGSVIPQTSIATKILRMSLVSTAMFTTFGSAAITLTPSVSQATSVETRVLELYDRGLQIRSVYGSFPNPASYYTIVEDVRLPNGQKDHAQIQLNRKGLDSDTNRMNMIVRELRTLNGGRFYADSLINGREPMELRALYEIAARGAYEGTLNPLTGRTFVHPRAQEIMAELRSIETRYGGEPKARIQYRWADAAVGNREIIAREIAEYAELMRELRALPGGEDMERARMLLPNPGKRLETTMPARLAHQVIQEPVELPPGLDATFALFQPTHNVLKAPMTGGKCPALFVSK